MQGTSRALQGARCVVKRARTIGRLRGAIGKIPRAISRFTQLLARIFHLLEERIPVLFHNRFANFAAQRFEPAGTQLRRQHIACLVVLHQQLRFYRIGLLSRRNARAKIFGNRYAHKVAPVRQTIARLIARHKIPLEPLLLGR